MKKILIIEDENPIAELERDYLEIEGFDVTISNDGKEGLNLALGEDFNLVILDLMLPSMDGYNVCRKIREKKDVSIIMVSAKKEDIDKIRGIGLGADDYMTKPFSPQELVARVKGYIKRYDTLTGKARSSMECISISGMQIEPESRRVYVEDEEVMLTNKEFDTLLLLAQNPNVVFSKTQLFEKIWSMDSLGDTTTVLVHIRRIREKIEKEPSNPKYIETVWGAGYRFKRV
ncbi:MAG: response regulator transcription factor [Acidaminobacteraceae bacterium]